MLECINTIENIYTNVYIAIKNGDTQIEDYLKSNPNIFVYNISTDVFESDNGYILDFTCKFNSIVLFCGEYKHRKVVDKDGYHVAACFVSSNGKEYSFLQGHDLDEFVIPYLRSNNIKVIKCYAPDLERIPNKKIIFFMTRVWRVVRRCFPSTFNYLRHLVRGTRHLIDDQKGLTNDMSRGYSLMYGNGKYINFDDGFRRTIRDDDVQPDGNVFVFGPCFIRGLGNEDGNTLPSLLQRKIPYKKVYNYGSEFQTVNLIMRLPEYNPGDVAVVFDINTFSDRNTAMYDGYYDMTESYQKVPHVWKHVFDDIMHYDYAVHNMIAEDLSTVVCSTLSDINKDEFDHSSVIFGAGVKKAADLRLFSEDELLIHWLDNVDGIVPYHHESRGAIVMNCNPFTNGHRYLIDYARKKVDTLIVFVLQEERSFFSFQDRIKLVKEGTRDFDNVYVVPSGSFIISSPLDLSNESTTTVITDFAWIF